MKPKVNKKEEVKVSKADLLALANKLKDRDLFPKKTEEARNFLKKAKSRVSL